MKFNLTITEMTDEEFAQVAKAFNFNSCEEVSKTDTTDIILTNEPVEGDFEEPAPFEPAYDKNGLPWDARIHSSNHKLTDKGVWQRRRGITDMEFERVRNELLGITTQPIPQSEIVVPAPVEPVYQPAPTPAPVVAPTPLVTEPMASVVVEPQPMFPTTPVAPVAQVAQVSQPVAPVDANILYQTMFEKIKAGMAAGAVKANDVQNLINTVNAQFGTQYQTLAAVKDNANVLQYIINDLASKGL